MAYGLYECDASFDDLVASSYTKHTFNSTLDVLNEQTEIEMVMPILPLSHHEHPLCLPPTLSTSVATSNHYTCAWIGSCMG